MPERYEIPSLATLAAAMAASWLSGAIAGFSLGLTAMTAPLLDGLGLSLIALWGVFGCVSALVVSVRVTANMDENVLRVVLTVGATFAGASFGFYAGGLGPFSLLVAMLSASSAE